MLLNFFLYYRIDLLLFAGATSRVCWACRRQLRNQHPRVSLPRRVWLGIAGIVLVGVLVAEGLTIVREKEFASLARGITPSLAHEFRQSAPESLAADTSPTPDQISPAFNELKSLWNTRFPFVRSILLFHRTTHGAIETIAGDLNTAREQREFESRLPSVTEVFRSASPALLQDRRPGRLRWFGYAPIFDQTNQVALVLVAEFTPSSWIRGTLLSRSVGLLAALAFIAFFIQRAFTSTVLRSERQAREEVHQHSQLSSDAATAVNRAKSEFLSVVSHEIRSPLTAVLGFANVLSETRLNDTQKRYVDTIVRAGDRLAALINDILDLSKMEEGRMVLENTPFVPALVIHEVIDSFSSQALAKQIELSFTNESGRPLTIEGDPMRFRQLLVNLVGNAVKYTERGAIIVKASWEAPNPDHAHGRLKVQISDTGVGIAPERISQLSRCFRQTNNAPIQRYGRPGLGLAICHRLLNLMNGQISVQSELGSGTTIEFSFPAPLSRPDSTLPSSASSSTAPAASSSNRLLVVDDEAVNQELLRILVRRAGYDCDVAAGGEEAVALVKENEYAAILMDLEMPDPDGYVTTRRIRADERSGNRIPIIAVTAITARGTREKCMAAGMDEYLTKPIYLPALQSTLSAYLARDRNEQS